MCDPYDHHSSRQMGRDAATEIADEGDETGTSKTALSDHSEFELEETQHREEGLVRRRVLLQLALSSYPRLVRAIDKRSQVHSRIGGENLDHDPRYMCGIDKGFAP